MLKFVGGSTPERAHGLNRLGLIQEIVRLHNGQRQEARYFGFMTASGEQSLSQAKAALESGNKDQVNYVAAQGISGDNGVHYSVKYMLKPASYRWSNVDEFAQSIQTDLAGERSQKYRESLGDSPATFLYSIRSAVLSSDSRSESHFMHNGKFFRMVTVKTTDKRVAGQLLKKSLIADVSSLVRLNGTIYNDVTHEESSFSLWFDKSDPNDLPLRFEFRPKSYLRLQFDAVPTPVSRRKK